MENLMKSTEIGFDFRVCHSNKKNKIKKKIGNIFKKIEM